MITKDRLPNLWRKFKACNTARDWSRFDQLISELDRWDEIHYPLRSSGI